MLKKPLKGRLLLFSGIIVPLILFLITRSVASWRPQRIGTQSLTHTPPTLYTPPPSIDSRFLRLSPDGLWLRVEYPGSAQRIWNTAGYKSRACDLRAVQFSQDSTRLAGWRLGRSRYGRVVSHTFSIVLQTPEGKEIWASSPRRYSEYIQKLAFTNNTIQVTTSKHVYNFDVKTGRLGQVINKVYNREYGAFGWRLVEEMKSPNGSKSYAFSEILGPRKIPTRKYQVDVLSAPTSRKIWSYPTRYSDLDRSGLWCIPQWEQDGKTLATIENDTLLVHNAETGKILVEHKNNLPNSLKSWALTRDGSTAYLMDGKGGIFRQRLR